MGNIDAQQQELYSKTVEAVRRLYEIGNKLPVSIDSISLNRDKCLMVMFQNELEVKLPLSFSDEHFKRLVYVYKDLNLKEVPVKSIDLTFRHVVVKKKDAREL